MVFWTGILVTIFGIIFIVVFTIYMVVSNKTLSKIKVRQNADLIEFKSTQKISLIDSYTRGIIKTKLKRPNGTFFFEFYPTDVEQGQEIQRPDIKYIVVKSEFVKINAEGRRTIITILPRGNLDSPKDLVNTNEGNELSKEGQKAWILSRVGKLMTDGDDAFDEILKEFTRVGTTKKGIASMREDMERAKKMSRPVDFIDREPKASQ